MKLTVAHIRNYLNQLGVDIVDGETVDLRTALSLNVAGRYGAAHAKIAGEECIILFPRSEEDSVKSGITALAAYSDIVDDDFQTFALPTSVAKKIPSTKVHRYSGDVVALRSMPSQRRQKASRSAVALHIPERLRRSPHPNRNRKTSGEDAMVKGLDTFKHGTRELVATMPAAVPDFEFN